MKIQDSIVVVAGARTAIGTYGGSLKGVPAYLLGAAAVREAVQRSTVNPSEVDEVVMGCVGEVGPDAFNARRVTLAADIPVTTPAMNVNRLCGSGVQAIWTGVSQILLGESDIVVAGGDENMTRQPFLEYGGRSGYSLANRELTDGTLSLVTDPWGNYPMGVTAENVADRFDVSREQQDEFALRSQTLAAKALADGAFSDQIVPISVKDRRSERVFEVDEHPRPDTTMDKLGKLRPVFREGGTVTAGNSSGINDAGAAVVLMREGQARSRGLQPMVRIAGFAKAAIEPEIMGYAPTYAIRRALDQVGLKARDLDLVELNEAFAAQAVAVVRDTDLDPEIVNPLGGAIALGHPIGATGSILVIKAMYEMQRRQLEWGLVSMCIGGGQAVATVLQSVR